MSLQQRQDAETLVRKMNDFKQKNPVIRRQKPLPQRLTVGFLMDTFNLDDSLSEISPSSTVNFVLLQ